MLTVIFDYEIMMHIVHGVDEPGGSREAKLHERTEHASHKGQKEHDIIMSDGGGVFFKLSDISWA